MKVVSGARGIATLGLLHKGGLKSTRLAQTHYMQAHTTQFQPLLQALVSRKNADAFERMLALADDLFSLPGKPEARFKAR
eukprot:2781085-Prorocentrum_lima.AAC.1